LHSIFKDLNKAYRQDVIKIGWYMTTKKKLRQLWLAIKHTKVGAVF